MSMIVKDMIRMGENRLIAANIMNPKTDAEELYMFITGSDRTEFFMQWNDSLDDRICDRYFDLIEKRCTRVPLQHLTGYQEFMGLKIEVNDKVLIPRPETEALVEQAVKIVLAKNTESSNLSEDTDFFQKIASRRKWKILDLCCGSGVIGITMAHRCANAKVTVTDISSDAVKLAKKNAADTRVKLNFECGNLFEPIAKKQYDLIISNPPYVKTYMIPILQEEVKNHEPIMALDGGEDGLDFYRRIIEEAPAHLKKQGVLMLEIGHDQGADIKKLIEKNGAFGECLIMKDFNDYDRAAITTLK